MEKLVRCFSFASIDIYVQASPYESTVVLDPDVKVQSSMLGTKKESTNTNMVGTVKENTIVNIVGTQKENTTTTTCNIDIMSDVNVRGVVQNTKQ